MEIATTVKPHYMWHQLQRYSAYPQNPNFITVQLKQSEREREGGRGREGGRV